MDYVDEYRLVVATPNSRGWGANDEAYLQSIAASIIEQIGAKNIEAFWLAGHSAGSAHTRRMVCNPFYRDKVDGVLTLGGGRIGSATSAGGPPGPIPPVTGAAARPASPPGATPPIPPPGVPPRAAAPEPVFDCDFSFIFVVGEHEAIAQTLPTDSNWAKRYGCQDRRTVAEITDTGGGLVWDPSRQPGNDAWGHEPRGGTAKIMRFPNCRDGRVVADIVRLDKGHTEGVEPRITEEIVRLMKDAAGGKLARS
jgi:hypothetical protein